MALLFHPKAGDVLICDFRGYIVPEIVKRRPVVIVGRKSFQRPGLVTVVPLSSTKPTPELPYHYKFTTSPVPNAPPGMVCWAKCDLSATVALERLDRFRMERGRYETGRVTVDELRELRRMACLIFGIAGTAP